MTRVVLIRHAEPLVSRSARPGAQWPLTNEGKGSARALGDTGCGEIPGRAGVDESRAQGP